MTVVESNVLVVGTGQYCQIQSRRHPTPVSLRRIAKVGVPRLTVVGLMQLTSARWTPLTAVRIVYKGRSSLTQ
jgi:hypothetical protein